MSFVDLDSDKNGMYNIIGRFLRDVCPNEVVWIILEYLSISNVVDFGVVCKMFHKISLFWMKNRNIADGDIVREFIETKVEWFGALVEINAFNHDFLIEEISFELWNEGTERNRLILRKYPKTRRSKTAKQIEDEKKLIETKNRKLNALNAICSRCIPSKLGENTLENKILFPIMKKIADDYPSNFHVPNVPSRDYDFIKAFSKNPHVDFLLNENFILSFLIPSYTYYYLIDSEKTFIDALFESGQYDPKNIYFISPRRSRKMKEEKEEEDTQSQVEVEPFPIFSWYEYAMDEKKNFALFEYQRYKIGGKWKGDKDHFPFYCLRFWSKLHLKTRLYRKTVYKLVALCHNASHNVGILFNLIMSTCEIVDQEKWDEKSEIPTLYQMISQFGTFEAMERILINKFSRPILFRDIESISNPICSPEFFYAIMKNGSHLFPSDWIENETHIRKILEDCFGRGDISIKGSCLREFFSSIDRKYHNNEKIMVNAVCCKTKVLEKNWKLVWKKLSDMYFELTDDYFSSDRRILDLLLDTGLPLNLEVLMYLMKNLDEMNKNKTTNDLVAFILLERKKESEAIRKELLDDEDASAALTQVFDFSLRKFRERRQLSFGGEFHMPYGLGLDYLFVILLKLFHEHLPRNVMTHEYIFTRAKCEWSWEVASSLKVCSQFCSDHDKKVEIIFCKTCGFCVCKHCFDAECAVHGHERGVMKSSVGSKKCMCGGGNQNESDDFKCKRIFSLDIFNK